MNNNAFVKRPQKSMAQKAEPLILPLVTAMGAFGGFPEPPSMFKNIIKNIVVQYFLLFLLIWQGGGGQNWKLSAKVTVVIFVLITAMKMFESNKKENFNQNSTNRRRVRRRSPFDPTNLNKMIKNKKKK